MKAKFPVFGPNGYINHVIFKCYLCEQEKMTLANKPAEQVLLSEKRELEKTANYVDISTAIRAGWLFIQGHGFTAPDAVYPMAVCPRHVAQIFQPKVIQ